MSLCKGITKAGVGCSRRVKEGEYCYQHTTYSTSSVPVSSKVLIEPPILNLTSTSVVSLPPNSNSNASNASNASNVIKFYDSINNEFKGFSNYSNYPVVFDSVTYPTSEHAYHSMKFFDKDFGLGTPTFNGLSLNKSKDNRQWYISKI